MKALSVRSVFLFAKNVFLIVEMRQLYDVDILEITDFTFCSFHQAW